MDTFKNIMENGAFAPKEQMLHFPQCFHIHDISKMLLWRKGLRHILPKKQRPHGYYDEQQLKKHIYTVMLRQW